MNETITEPYKEAAPLFTCDGIGSEAKKKLFHEIITRAMHAREARLQKPSCSWVYNDYHDYYDTGCGKAYCFKYEFIPSGSHKFCSGCGGEVGVAKSADHSAKHEAALNQQNEAEKK